MSDFKSFETHGVVTTVIPTAPKYIATVAFESAKAELGKELTPTQVQHAPTVEWEANSDKFYTVVMTDPDAPSRDNPIRGEWLHWTVVNIPGSSLSEGEIMAEYVGAGPPPNTGLHRYVVVVLEQPSKIDTARMCKVSKHRCAYVLSLFLLTLGRQHQGSR